MAQDREAPSPSLRLWAPLFLPQFAGRSKSPRGPSSWRCGAITEPSSYSLACHITSFRVRKKNKMDDSDLTYEFEPVYPGPDAPCFQPALCGTASSLNWPVQSLPNAMGKDGPWSAPAAWEVVSSFIDGVQAWVSPFLAPWPGVSH